MKNKKDTTGRTEKLVLRLADQGDLTLVGLCWSFGPVRLAGVNETADVVSCLRQIAKAKKRYFWYGSIPSGAFLFGLSLASFVCMILSLVAWLKGSILWPSYAIFTAGLVVLLLLVCFNKTERRSNRERWVRKQVGDEVFYNTLNFISAMDVLARKYEWKTLGLSKEGARETFEEELKERAREIKALQAVPWKEEEAICAREDFSTSLRLFRKVFPSLPENYEVYFKG